MRDSRIDKNYFEKFLKSMLSGYSAYSEDVAQFTNAPHQSQYRPIQFSMLKSCSLSLLQGAYSIGEPLDQIQIRLVEATEAFLLMKRSDIQYMPEEKVKIRHSFRTRRDTYIDALWILSLNILFESSDDRIREVIEATGNAGVDGVFDRVASRFVPGREISDEVVYAAPYRRLLAVFDAPEEERPKLMTAFLKVWYQQNKKTDWWGEAERIEFGSVLYSGYWCFEAAAVVKLLGIDDSLFRDNEYYPSDLAHLKQEHV